MWKRIKQAAGQMTWWMWLCDILVFAAMVAYIVWLIK